MNPLPYDVTETMVQCFGKCFHFKDGVASFFLAEGVQRALVDKYRHEPKFVWARHVLTDLGQSEDGCVTQRKLLTALCNLRNLPDAKVPDRDAGLETLRQLKHLALEKDLVARKTKENAEAKSRLADERAKLVRDRKTKLEKLCKAFTEAVTSPDRQKAGYTLEEVLEELFALFEIEYRKSYRTSTQQIDGHFSFNGFDYLVEARWRKDMPTEQEIGGFKQKVDSKLESTRGLFISVAGFRPAVAAQFNGRGAKIILIDGSHLIHVLEGRFDLRDALKTLIEKAAQEGLVYTPLIGR